MSLSSISIKRPITTFMIFIAVLIIGGVSSTRLAIDLLPDITYPIVAVMTNYSGAGPADVEKMVTKTIERGIATVNNIKEINSTSYNGGSLVLAKFEWGTNMDEAASDVRERISLVKRALPDDAEEPLIVKFDPSLMPIMVLNLSGEDLVKLRHLAEEEIKYKLEQVKGVASVNITGGKKREIQVKVDRNQLAAVNLSLSQVVNAIRAENLNLPAGYQESGSQEFLVRTVGEFKKVSQIGDIVVAYRNGTPVYLRDVAEIEDSFEEKRNEILINGKPGIVLIVQKQSGTNTVQVANRIHKQISHIKEELPSDVEIGTIMDTSKFIKDSISQLEQTAIQGAIIAALIVFLFLFNIPSTLIIISAIPISIVITFILLNFAKLTLNIMTLGGLALGIGMMIDNAIVVLENIFRHRERGETVGKAAVTGADEVGMAITASTLTTLVVFFSLLFTTGIAGILFKHIAYTVVFSLLASLIVALTLIPVLSSKYLIRMSVEEEKKKEHIARRLNRYMENRYRPILNWALIHRKTVIIGSLSLLGISFLLFFPHIGREFIPQADEGQFTVSVEMPIGSQLNITSKVTKQVEKIIRKDVPELNNIFTQVGISSESGMAIMGGNEGSFEAQTMVRLVDLDKRSRSSQEVVNALRPQLSKLAQSSGAKIRIKMGEEMTEFLGTPIAIEVKGYDLIKGERLAQEISHLMKKVDGVTDTNISYRKGQPELQIEIDRERASSLGLNLFQIANAVQTANKGTVASLFHEGGDEYNILVRLQEEDRQTPSDLEKIFITSPSGQQISLDTIAKVHERLGPVKIERKDQQRIITVSAQSSGRDLGSIDKDIREGVEKLEIPEDFSIEFAGQQKEMVESFHNLYLCLILAIILVYMVMASQFESLRHPFVIMFSIPFAAIGVILMLFFTHTTLSIIVHMGLIMLAGIVVNNGIVMISYINILRNKGMPLMEAARVGAERRLRPILMTTFTTIFALLPMALGFGAGAELWSPMARTVIGGLAVSMLFTLIFTPTLYTLLAGKKR